MSRRFDALALPRSVDGEDVASAAYEEGGLDVRHVDASPEWIARVATALRLGGESLGAVGTRDVARSLGLVGARFLDGADPLRAEALGLLPATSGLSPEMAAAVLDGMAADWTEERLLRLLRAELGQEGVLDGFVPSADGGDAGSGPAGPARTMAFGPRLCVQIVAGSVPGVGVTALLRSLLLKAPTLLKPGRGDVVLPVLFARALREVDARVADALAVVYWPGGEREAEEAALAEADVVVAYGSDETVGDLRTRTPVTTRFVAYHHRISVGIVGRGALTDEALDGTAAEVAEAVAFFDRRGCVSPQVVYVEEGAATPEAFARCLAERLRRLEDRLPSGRLDPAEASDLHQFRGTVELMAASGRATVIHGGGAGWTVVLESGEGSPGTCAGRTVRIRAVRDVRTVPELLAPLGSHLQTVGVAGLGERLEGVARACGGLGASRVVPFSSVAFPPPWWHHDGRGPLRDLVRWVDLEEG